jgi:hypothetical protein
MGHIKDTVPESPINMTLKDFMVTHVTNYWPGVFRGLTQDWPAFTKWQNEQYFVAKAGFDMILVDTSKKGEVIPSFMTQDHIKPKEMSYYDFLRKASKHNEDGENLFIDNITPLPQGLQPDVSEPTVTG